MSRKSNLYMIVALFVSSYLFIGIMPAEANENDWNSLTVTLGHENSVVSVNEYTLEALKFDGYGMVWVQVSKNDVTLGDAVLENNSSSWCYMDSDNIRLKVCNVTDKRSLPMFASVCSPEAEIVFETKRTAEDKMSLELDIEADKEEYFLDDEVIVDMELRNTGEVEADKIRFDVDSDGLLVQKGGPENINLDKGSKKSCELQFKFPEKVKENYNITANVSWEDGSGKHFLSKTVEIKVSKPLEIYKNTGPEAFPGGPVYVTVSVKNVQDRAVNVSLIDLLPATFTIINNSELDSNVLGSNSSSYLSWEYLLAPEEKKILSYSIKSEQLGAHRLPQAHAYVNLCGQLYTESSDSEDLITIYGNILYREYKNETMTEAIPPVKVKLHVNLVPT
ncbi:hypothetical protein BGV40_14190 [Methanosarcina sp. Ant1]|nr:hypothetical protein BGV40_14190 [Methanosarcina sp. Ant1]